MYLFVIALFLISEKLPKSKMTFLNFNLNRMLNFTFFFIMYVLSLPYSFSQYVYFYTIE